jgi:glycosyltransferase involved in cell wall biosynthesis
MRPVLNCGIIGDGDKRKNIEGMIQDLNLDNHVTLFGSLPYVQVIEIMHSSKILLHTSLFEGQGLVFTEALAAGAYVVSYPVGITCNIASKKVKTGKTKEALTQHVINILSDKDPDYLPEIFFTNENTCKEYMENYNALLK